MTDKQKQVVKFAKSVMRDIARVIFLFGFFYIAVEVLTYWISTGHNVRELIQYIAAAGLVSLVIVVGCISVYYWIQNRWDQSKIKDVETYDDSR